MDQALNMMKDIKNIMTIHADGPKKIFNKEHLFLVISKITHELFSVNTMYVYRCVKSNIRDIEARNKTLLNICDIFYCLVKIASLCMQKYERNGANLADDFSKDHRMLNETFNLIKSGCIEENPNGNIESRTDEPEESEVSHSYRCGEEEKGAVLSVEIVKDTKAFFNFTNEFTKVLFTQFKELSDEFILKMSFAKELSADYALFKADGYVFEAKILSKILSFKYKAIVKAMVSHITEFVATVCDPKPLCQHVEAERRIKLIKF